MCVCVFVCLCVCVWVHYCELTGRHTNTQRSCVGWDGFAGKAGVNYSVELEFKWLDERKKKKMKKNTDLWQR